MPFKKVVSIIACLICLLTNSRFFGQDLNFVHYSVNDGLPSSQVHDIIQDKYGYVWFSTDQGLSRYDGYGFKNYTTSDGLTDNVVFKFYPKDNGDIWCTTFSKSVFCLSGKDPVFKHYPYNKKLLEIQDVYVTNDLCISKKGDLFMSAYNGAGYMHLDGKGMVLHNSIGVFSSSEKAVLLADRFGMSFYFIEGKNTEKFHTDHWPHYITTNLRPGANGAVRACFFEGAKGAVFIYSNGITILKEHASDSLVIPTAYEPISLGKLNDTLFWVGYRYGGLSIYNLSGSQVRSFLPDKSVTKLFTDTEGGLWFSTLNDGVYHINNTQVISYRNDSESWVNSLLKDQNNNLWIGYYNGDVSVLSGGKFAKKYKSVNKLPALIRHEDVSKKVYFISDNKIFNAEGKDLGYGFNNVNASVFKNDSFLISGYSSVDILYDGKKEKINTGFRSNDICMYKGTIYMAGNSGLYKIQGRRIDPVVNTNIPAATKIGDLNVWNRYLVMATKGRGILIYDGNKVDKIDKKSGLSNDIVNRIYSENDSTLWACTNSGLNRITLKKNSGFRVKIISNRNGLISNEITDMEIIRDTVWVGTREGLCSFPLAMLQGKTEGQINYYLEINSVKANDKILVGSALGAIKYDQNRIEFNFKAISFIKDSPLQYRYKLKGLEDSWNYTTRLSALYPSLPPGNYTFCVQAKGNNDSWETGEQNFTFSISPPFWQTWWFRTSVVFALAVMVYLFFKFRILTYNRDITRELLRQLLKRLTGKTHYVVFREQGKDIRISTHTIYFVQADGNYIEIHTDTKKYVIRYKIGEFLKLVPDPLEYLRISRSCIIRLDKVQEKSKKDVTVRGEKIPVGETYLDQLAKIQF